MSQNVLNGRCCRLGLFTCLVVLLSPLMLVPAAVQAETDGWPELLRRLGPVSDCLTGKTTRFELDLQADVVIDGKPQPISVTLTRFNKSDYRLHASHPDYAVAVERNDTQTRFVLPRHNVAYVGRGDVAAVDHLTPSHITSQLISDESQVGVWLPLLTGPSAVLQTILRNTVDMEYTDSPQQWTIGDIVISAADDAALLVTGPTFKIRVNLREPAGDSWTPLPVERQQELTRVELERQLSRGVRRALAVLAPSPVLTVPEQMPAKVEHGELRWVDGQRLVLLSGTPEQIGTAHAQLLRTESIRCMDSVLHAFGTVQTIRTGRWFRHDLEAAYARLEPHIPEDHQRELAALASELGWDVELVKTLNVFPELFHCSGFAVFGAATADGRLYHGRVLDYMTTIGLQDAATTFVIAPQGKLAFANVGYGGFIGSVSGMNGAGISLGEMGGRGEGQWDGVPMATLMRRALEECDTLDEVIELWTTSPRTCEYYYVFSQSNAAGTTAVGVAATPDSIQIVRPGEGHELLGPGIADTVVLSAGDRLTTLKTRVREKYGQIDAPTAMWLMSRPVAMSSNLHNVLFVPETGILYVANASHSQPAAERPYVKFDLRQAIEELTTKGNIRTVDATD